MEADQVAPPSVILSDGDAFESIKEKSRSRYKKTWNKFVMFNDKSGEIQYRVPSEIDLMNYMKNLRNEEGNILLFIFSNMSVLQTIMSGYASTSLWTTYSMLNAVCRAKYGINLKIYVRLAALLKSFDIDTKKKASVFSKDDIDKFLAAPDLTTPYWIVRKVVMY